MRIITGVIIVTMELILILLGLTALFGGKFGIEPLGVLIPSVLDTGVGLGLYERLAWIGIMLLPVLHWVLLFEIRRGERSITLETSGGGSLTLYHSAIIQYVRNGLTMIPEISDHRVQVRHGRGGALSLTIHVTLNSVESIPKLQNQIEGTIRRQLTEVLGIDKIQSIKVVVKNFGELELQSVEPKQEIAIHAPTSDDDSEQSGTSEPEVETINQPEDRESFDEPRDDGGPLEITLQPPPGPEPVEMEAETIDMPADQDDDKPAQDGPDDSPDQDPKDTDNS